ncbi:3030_t:CDS:2 [Funneliformis mosseae]|uniref:3030_t:CDS:1 n=1 Tax=Funneliformis mosseae TaxID=27381 RepID=A0A9N9N3H0_FUNMO|nr:3030_t:CDS:2 [Funneliformis mosseae]
MGSSLGMIDKNADLRISNLKNLMHYRNWADDLEIVQFSNLVTQMVEKVPVYKVSFGDSARSNLFNDIEVQELATAAITAMVTASMLPPPSPSPPFIKLIHAFILSQIAFYYEVPNI